MTRNLVRSLFLAALLVVVDAARRVEAGIVLTATEVSGNVVLSGSGTADLTGLSLDVTADTVSFMLPSEASLDTGPTGAISTDQYKSVTGPSDFGSGAFAFATSGTGDRFGVSFVGGVGVSFFVLFVPHGYVSGSQLEGTSTFANQTFASLGMTPGTHVWSWDPAAHDDTFTLSVRASAVPEPSSAVLTAFGAVALLAGWSRRRKEQRRQAAA
jgi:hypothetical protein